MSPLPFGLPPGQAEAPRVGAIPVFGQVLTPQISLGSEPQTPGEIIASGVVRRRPGSGGGATFASFGIPFDPGVLRPEDLDGVQLEVNGVPTACALVEHLRPRDRDGSHYLILLQADVGTLAAGETRPFRLRRGVANPPRRAPVAVSLPFTVAGWPSQGVPDGVFLTERAAFRSCELFGSLAAIGDVRALGPRFDTWATRKAHYLPFHWDGSVPALYNASVQADKPFTTCTTADRYDDFLYRQGYYDWAWNSVRWAFMHDDGAADDWLFRGLSVAHAYSAWVFEDGTKPAHLIPQPQFWMPDALLAHYALTGDIGTRAAIARLADHVYAGNLSNGFYFNYGRRGVGFDNDPRINSKIPHAFACAHIAGDTSRAWRDLYLAVETQTFRSDATGAWRTYAPGGFWIGSGCASGTNAWGWSVNTFMHPILFLVGQRMNALLDAPADRRATWRARALDACRFVWTHYGTISEGSEIVMSDYDYLCGAPTNGHDIQLFYAPLFGAAGRASGDATALQRSDLLIASGTRSTDPTSALAFFLAAPKQGNENDYFFIDEASVRAGAPAFF